MISIIFPYWGQMINPFKDVLGTNKNKEVILDDQKSCYRQIKKIYSKVAGILARMADES